MQVLQLLHEVFFEMTFLLFFFNVFFLLKQLLALFFCFVLPRIFGLFPIHMVGWLFQVPDHYCSAVTQPLEAACRH